MTNNFLYIEQPLLMSTVALAGIPLIMPYMYQKIRYTPSEVRDLIAIINLHLELSYREGKIDRVLSGQVIQAGM